MKICMGCMNQIEEHYSICPYCKFNQTSLRRESYYLDPGTIIGGKYILGKDLSYGGHTVSYIGLDAETNRKVIIKEYLPSDFSTRSEGENDITIYSGDGQVQFEQGLTNFLNEANRIQQLGHPEGIAKVYDCVAENDTGYVISEYVEGRTLKEILASGKKYSANEARAFIIKILRGLVNVHKMDIVHCDISPETIMVTNTGEIKLIDFGATRYVTTANSKSLSIILKRGYAPEEQYRSRGVRGPWTDVYALGAVMYQMLTGIVPQESVERVLSDELKAPSKLGVSIPENMENALLNALNVYKDERTPSAEAFLKELNSPNVKRIKTKRKSNKTGKFPIWAKGLVACLCCAVIVGGVFLFQKIGKDNSDVTGDGALMEDMTGMTTAEAEEYIAKLNKENGWEIEFEEGDTVFDLSAAEGTVSTQSFPAGIAIPTAETEEDSEDTSEESVENEDQDSEEAASEIEKLGLVCDADGKVSGTITCDIYTREKIRYAEIRSLNAYQLAQKLHIDTENESLFIGEAENQDDHTYYDILSLDADGTEISIETLNDEDGEIAYKEGAISITYSKAPFFYWEELPDFVGTNIADWADCPIYEWKAENDKKPTQVGDKTLDGTNLVVADYYSTKADRQAGYIVEQTIAAGETLDTSKGLEEPLLHVIAQCIEPDGVTGYTVKEQLEALGGNITVQAAGSTDMSQAVMNADLLDADGNYITEFKLEDPVTVKLYLKAKPTPTPAASSGSSSQTGDDTKPLDEYGH